MRNTFRYSFATVLTAGLVTTPLTAAFAETDGSDGVASGNQIVVPVDAAVDICGNAVSVLGIAEAGCMEAISDGGEGDSGDEDDGKEDEDEGDNGNEDEGDEGDSGNEDEGDESDEDDGKEDDDNGKGDEGDDKPAPSADGELPVTGGALGGLITAALAAVGAGGAGLYFTRKRKLSAATADDE